MITKDLGVVTAYGYAVTKGYTGTEEEFAELMASYATVAESAAQSAQTATEKAQAAAQAVLDAVAAKDAAVQAKNDAVDAKDAAAQSATNAASSATAASGSATNASQSAQAASDSASAAAQSATDASGSATAANTAKEAAVSAQGAAETAQGKAETAQGKAEEAQEAAEEAARTLTIDATLTQSGLAADAKAAGDKIADLKSDIKHTNEGNETFGLYDSFVNGTQEYGVYNHWYTFRVTNENILSFDRDLHVTVKSGYRFFLSIFVNGSYVSETQWQTSKYTIQKNTNFKIVIAKNPEASGTADIDEYVNAVTFVTAGQEKTYAYIDENIVTVNKGLKQVYPASLLLDKNNYTMTDIRHLRMKVTSTDTWQPSSYIKFENLAVYQNQSIYVHTDARSINGTSVTACAAVFYQDSNGDTISTYAITYGTSGVNMSTGACDVIVKAPAGCTKIKVEFWGIAGATPQIGDEVWIDGACVVVGNIKFKDSFCDPAVIYALPSTWASKIQTIQTAQKGYFTFGVQTDTHFINNVGWNFGGDNFSKLTTYVGLDFICNLGDIIRGYNTSFDTPAKTRESYNVLMHRYITNLKCPLLLTVGNHDTGQSYAQTQSDPTLELSLAEIYSRIMPFVFNSTPKIVSNGRSLYYYVDFDESNIRVIVANTTDGEGSIHDGYPSMFCISQAQLTWLTTVALDTDKQVIFMTHCPLLESLTGNRVENGTAMLQALSDFKSGGGNLIGCFYGHTHRQSHAVDENGILHMTFNDGAECAEVVIVDTTNKVINTYGLGVDQEGNQNSDRGPISY